MFKNLLEEFHSLLKSDGLQTQTEKLKSSNKFLLVLFLFLSALSVNATDYYVSNSGNDSNPGTSPEQAWKTLDKVNSFMPQPGDKILFNRGDEWVGTINVNASGRLGSNIVYGAFGTGANPKIYGSEIITSWTQHSGNIYKAKISASGINQVFINGEKMTSARYPNSGYFDITKVNSSNSFTSAAINGSINYSGAVACIRTREWYIATQKVSNSSSQTLTIPSAPMYSLNVGEGFFLFNKLEFLDAAGEWYFDDSNDVLYVWTKNGTSPSDKIVRASTINNLTEINGKSYITIKELDLNHANQYGVYIYNSDYINLDKLNIAYADQIGVEISSTGSSNVTVQACTINYSSYFGYRSSGNDHLVTDNTVKNIGLMSDLGVSGTNGQSGAGIYFRYGKTGNNKARYNTIKNTGYNGIWFWDCPKTTVEYNYVYGACLTIEDGGGIYCFESTTAGEDSDNSIIRSNIVDYVPGNGEGYTATTRQGDGIYTDDRISHVTIENNTVTRASHYAIYLHNNKYVTVKNNTFFDNGSAYRATGAFNATKNILENNIIVNIASSKYSAFMAMLNSNESSIIAIDNNTYIDHHRNKPFRDMSNYSYKTFSEWKSATNQDANSTFNGSPLADGEYEKLFYNETKSSKKISLGSTSYRDIYGNTVSGSITLNPFTSKILIKTSSESSSSNQSPSIQEQTFGTTGDLTLDEFVGQVFANDPDDGQVLTYSIISGNEGGLFYIDSATGDIYSSSDVQITQDKSVALTIKVTDDATEPLSANAIVTIDISAAETRTTDTTSPTVSSFTIPSSSSTLTVSVSSFEASDNQSVTGYLLTESSTVPSVDNGSWKTSAPSEYTFTKDGKNVLYAWVKDAAENISAAVAATVTISLPDLTATSSAYLFEESNGNIAVDSECSNDGEIINEEIRISGAKDKGLKFTGSGYIKMGQCYGANVRDEVSLSAWIKPTTTGGYKGIIMHGGPNTDTYALYINPDLQRVAFKTTGTSASWSYKDNVYKLWDGNWHHLAVTYDGAEKIVYLDNEILLKTASTGSIESGEGYNLMVAAGRDETSPTLLYEGLIDEVRIYNYTISSTEVSKLYNIWSTDTVYTEENIYICDSESYEGWTESGQYMRTLQSSNGGDSIVTTNLHVYPTYNITEDVTIKEGESYKGWTESGLYTRTLRTINGCDSIATTKLTVLQSIYTTEAIEICDGESYEGWTETGNYERTLEASTGADSVVTTNLTVHPTYDITEDITIKEGESYEGWTESGLYTRTLRTINGCDSIATTKLTVLQSIFTTEAIEICDGESYEGWTESGNYERILEASTGADSVVTTNLTVHPTYDITEDITIKEGESYEGWTESGQYTRTLRTINGCDSIATTNLTVLQSIYTTEAIEICDGESYEGWTDSGNYERILEASTGADSVVTTNLTVHPTYDITEDITIKEGESYKGWTESGQYQRVLTTVFGCDSTVNTNLTVQQAVYTMEDVSFCEGESYEGWTETGQYERTLEASSGADSIVTTNLTVHPTNNITENIIINEGESYEGWTESGQYQRTLASVNGCDSIVTTNLTVTPQSVYSEYQFEEQSGTTVIDSKGSNDGNIAGNGLRVEGISGEGLQFSGSGYVKLGQSFGNIQKEVTLSAWINPDELSGGYQGIIMHGGPNIDTYGLYIYRNSHRIGFKTTGTTSNWTYVDNVSTLWDGSWHHLTVTYNGAEKIIYLDNDVLLTVNATGAIESGEGYNLYIGAGRDQEPAALPYVGTIDEVHIYNYALTASEISELFNTTVYKQTFYGEEDIFICNGDEYMGWTDSGRYERTLVSSIGGDSIVTTNLTVYPTYNIVEDITINEGDDYEGWTTSGQYVRTLNSQYGCDSMVTTKLTVLSAPSFYSEYLFEENSGSTVFDSKGTVDGTIYNEEIRVNGVNGDGLEFTGSGYVNLGQNYGSLQTEVTLSAWLKPEASARGNYQGVIMHGGPNTDTYALYLYPNSRRVAFKTTGTTEQWIYINDVNTLWDGNWHLITATYDGKEKVVYLDNTLIFRVAASGKIESGKGYNLYIGAGRDENKPKLLYNGQIDEVRIYNYALTGYEVETLYNGTEGNNIKEGQISTSADFNNLESKNSFNFYPNPAINFITLEYSFQPEQNTYIQIMDASGRMVYNQKTESLTERIDINNFPAGIYYIKSVNSKEQIVKKLIKR